MIPGIRFILAAADELPAALGAFGTVRAVTAGSFFFTVVDELTINGAIGAAAVRCSAVSEDTAVADRATADGRTTADAVFSGAVGASRLRRTGMRTR